MKLLREFCEIVTEHIPVFLFTGFVLLLLGLLVCCFQSAKLSHEYKMELLKQGKVSIESIK